jgi:acyl-CoA synthetase (NDP forming)
MPPLSKETESFLREKLLPEASINNPIDVLATAGPEHFAAAIDALINDDGIDAIFLNFVTPFFVDTLGVAREIADANRRSSKPIVATVMTEKKGWAETLKVIRDGGVPTYDMPETGARVLAAMGRYATLRKRPAEPPASFDDADTACARSIVETARAAGRKLLSAEDGFTLLACYGIPVAPWRIVGTADECLAAAEGVGYPVALKVDAESVVHKTDSGGVVLDIGDRETLRTRARDLAACFADASPRFLVQRHLPAGREVIVGAKAAEGLGHVVMFGLGGIYVEVLKDVSFGLTPVTQREAREMIAALQTYPLLAGMRGEAGVDLAALTEIIQRISHMLTEHSEIRELDLNPIFAFSNGATAADVRVLL